MLLLKNGSVLNIETGEFVKLDIYVEGNEIKNIAPNLNQEGISVIDCTNKWLIPGLIDMHVHIKKHFASYFTAAGVTTVRNTAGSVIELKPFMECKGNEPEPRVISADRMIDGPPGLWGEDSPYNLNVDNETLAKNEVERQVNLGADFIKVYGWLEPQYMKVVADEAKKHSKEVSSDILHSKKINAIDAANIGIDWLEHASGIVQAMYPEWVLDAPNEVYETIPWNQPDEEKIKAVCERLLEKNVNLCPTLVLYDQMRLAENYWTTNHEVIQHIENSPYLFKHWLPAAQSKSGQSSFGIQTKTIQKIAHTYFKMGGTVVTGTDTPAGIFTYPGFALHRELQLFVDAGFTPLEALQQATMNAAKALKIDNLGMLKENYIADILILNENPVQKIENTMTIDSIVKGGTSYTIEELLAHIPSEEEMTVYTNELMEKFKKLKLIEV